MSQPNKSLSPLDRLNSRQRKAATYGIQDGKATQHPPLLIIAGAGTGKTETLAIRIGSLIASGANPSEMFVASYTCKSAKELVERSRKTIKGRGSVPVQLPYSGTFHSIALTLLNEFKTHV